MCVCVSFCVCRQEHVSACGSLHNETTCVPTPVCVWFWLICTIYIMGGFPEKSVYIVLPLCLQPPPHNLPFMFLLPPSSLPSPAWLIICGKTATSGSKKTTTRFLFFYLNGVFFKKGRFIESCFDEGQLLQWSLLLPLLGHSYILSLHRP